MRFSSDKPMGPRRSGAERPRSERAYTLIGLVGVMAVAAILAAVLVPNELRSVSEADREREARALERLKEGLREYILNTRSIPAPATVFSNVANTLGWELSTALTNHRGNARLFLVDPNLKIGTKTAGTLPFVQGTYGFTNISNLRFLFVSSVGGALPAKLLSPGSDAATVFAMVWHAAEGQTPPGWTYGGNWADIRVARLSLDPWITRVRFIDYAYASSYGRISVDNTNVTKQIPSCDYSALYFVRTQLGLHSHLSPYKLQVLQVLQDVPLATNGPPYLLAPTFVYERTAGSPSGGEGAVWRGQFYRYNDGQKHNGDDLQWAYEIFMSGPANVYHVGSVTQDSLTRRMWEYMSNYVRWTELGFSTSFKQSVLAPSQQAMASELSTYCNKKASAY